ncbi:DUF3472 domain-containing protein [Parabacteroides sp. PH5-17]|uniref:DUF3472 domain-containing protein n=1 Tax=Parabacteroides sp. PH5-17 TaxID=2940642 RepID=UPI0024754D41|nr:DUF3472 domain-containing protein [Parabacteroides sp. PH5-17]
MELSENAVSVPIAGNTYVTGGKGDAFVSTEGIVRWTGEEAVLSSWFKVSHAGDLLLFLKAKAIDGVSELSVSCNGQTFSVQVKEEEETIISVGKVTLNEAGYVRVDMKGIKKEGHQFPSISELLIDGEAAQKPLYYVHDFETYWALRGPSVHMNYALPDTDVEYFYNEVFVPEGEDVVGSYFMVNGFGEGYCGIQVNSETERRILFSVWSPYETDNPSEIPENQRIQLLAKGDNVFAGEFGSEGSGGQSYLVFPWKAGETYRFLTRVCPDEKGNTQYYTWFFAPETEEWKLIAGFLRPQTNTWYTRAHSFLENFIPEQGYYFRSVCFKNQWARTSKGEWQELIEGTFTYDATAKSQVRMDYAGGVNGDSFFLKNGGFFNENTDLNSIFTRPIRNNLPKIEIDKLP